MVTQAIINDIHFPYHDRKVVDLFVEFCRKVKVGQIHLLGDIQNCGSLSLKFTEVPKDEKDRYLRHEIEMGGNFMEDLRDTFPFTPIYFYGGNHEWRLERYIRQHAKALVGLPGLDIQSILGLPRLGITYFPYGQLVRWGGLRLTHGDIVRSGSAMTARAMLQKYGTNVLFGHTHRGGVAYSSTEGGTVGAWENFCGCKLDQPYTLGPNNWQQGWSLVHNDLRRHFTVVPIRVERGVYIFEGKKYEWSKTNRFCGRSGI